MGNPQRPHPFLDSARRRRNQGNGVPNPRIIRLTASDVVAAPDAHPNSTRLSQRLSDAAWTLDKQRSISVRGWLRPSSDRQQQERDQRAAGQYTRTPPLAAEVVSPAECVVE
jgi:hypothetical protein